MHGRKYESMRKTTKRARVSGAGKGFVRKKKDTLRGNPSLKRGTPGKRGAKNVY